MRPSGAVSTWISPPSANCTAGLLAPFVYINDRQVGPKPAPVASEPSRGGTLLSWLRHARDRGRLSDLASHPYRSRLRFERPDKPDPRRWWNGLLYSWYQLLVLPQIDDVLARRTYRRRLVSPSPGYRSPNALCLTARTGCGAWPLP
jgi:hypothetical protein